MGLTCGGFYCVNNQSVCHAELFEAVPNDIPIPISYFLYKNSSSKCEINIEMEIPAGDSLLVF